MTRGLATIFGRSHSGVQGVDLTELRRPDSTFRSRTSRAWCPSQVVYLEEQFPNLLDVFENLQPLRSPLNHDKCQKYIQCQAIATQNPRRHVCGNVSCQDLVIAEEELIPILEKGDTPVLYFEHAPLRTIPGDEETGHYAGPRLRVRTRGPEDVYVAVSHVWADGLGNPTKNALPSCQIQKLYAYVSTILKPSRIFGTADVCFWLDTLCIPPATSTVFERLKKEQIAKMTGIYSQAYAVLVLDAGLMSIQDKDAVWGDSLLAQIMTCQWATRSWCYQESVLSERYAFKFANKILLLQRQDLNIRKPDHAGWRVHDMRRWLEPTVQLKQIIWLLLPNRSRGRTSKSPYTRSHRRIQRHSLDAVKPDVLQAFASRTLLARSIWSTSGYVDKSHVAFTKAWNAMAGCYTSEEEDVALIFATVLDFNITPLLTIPLHARMRRVCLSFNTLPLSLLFNLGRQDSDDNESSDWWMPKRPGHHVLPHCSGYLSTSRFYDTHYASMSFGTDGGVEEPGDSPYQILQLDTQIHGCEYTMTFDNGSGVRSYTVNLRRVDGRGQQDKTRKSYVVFEKARSSMEGEVIRGIYLYPITPLPDGRTYVSEATRKPINSYSSVPVTIQRASYDLSTQNVKTLSPKDLSGDNWIKLRIHRPLLNPEPPLELYERSNLKFNKRALLHTCLMAPLWLALILVLLAAAGGIGYGASKLPDADRNVEKEGWSGWNILLMILSIIGACFGAAGFVVICGCCVFIWAATRDWLQQLRFRRQYRVRFG